METQTSSSKGLLIMQNKKRRPRVVVVFEDDGTGSVCSSLKYRQEELELGLSDTARFYRVAFYVLAVLTMPIALHFPGIVMSAWPVAPEPKPKNLRPHESRRKTADSLSKASLIDEAGRTLSGIKHPCNMDFDELLSLKSRSSPSPVEDKVERPKAEESQSLHRVYEPVVVTEVDPRLVSIEPEEKSPGQKAALPRAYTVEMTESKHSVSSISTSYSSPQFAPSHARTELGQLKENLQFDSQPLTFSDELPATHINTNLYHDDLRVKGNVIDDESGVILGHAVHIKSWWQPPQHSRISSGREETTALQSERSEIREVLTERIFPHQLGSTDKSGRGYLTNGAAFTMSPIRVESSRRRLTDGAFQQADEYDGSLDEPGNTGLQSVYGTQRDVPTGSYPEQTYDGQEGQTVQSLDAQPTSTSYTYERLGSDEDQGQTITNQLGYAAPQVTRSSTYGEQVYQAGYGAQHASTSGGYEQHTSPEPYGQSDEAYPMGNGAQSVLTSGSYHGEAPYEPYTPSIHSYEADHGGQHASMRGYNQQLGTAQQSDEYQDSHVPQIVNPDEMSQQSSPSDSIPQVRAHQVSAVREQNGDKRSDADDKKESKVPKGPSHIGICRIVLGQEDGDFMEEHKLCLDEFAPSKPLAEIFLSTFLAHHARANGYRVEYDHNCGRHRSEQEQIQELLPSPLVVPGGVENDMTKEHIQGICKMIVDNEQRRRKSNALEILLWDTSSPTSGKSLKSPSQAGSVSMLERLAPMVLANMYTATMKSRVVKTALKAGYGVLKGRDLSSEHMAIGRAVVHLPCRDRDCEDLVLVPYTNYMLHLPLSVHIVDVVVSPRCLESLPGCRSYVNDLASTIRQFSPEMSVEVIAAEPSSPDVMARLVEAEHVLCGPGFGMVCLFPSLARDSGRVTLFDVGPDLIQGDAASSYVSRLPHNLIDHITPPTSAFSVAFLSDFGGQDEMMLTFAQLPPNKDAGECRFFRGRVGQWNQDMRYAEHAQYRTPLSHYSGNAEKVFRRKVANGEHGDLKYRPSTTYRFDEARYQTCAVAQTSQEGVCAMLKSLGARRIFILGDSLNLQMAQSMWMWLTNANHGESPTTKGSLDPNFNTTLQCMGYGSYTLQFVRNDELLENDEPVSIDKDQKNCQTFCYPWTKTYRDNPSRTIMIFNVGAHLHEFERYTAAIDRFVDVFDGMNRPNDLVLFRTLVPGHWDCSRPGLKPFSNFAAYKKDVEEHPNPKDEIYTWSKFSSYNDYAIRKLDNRRFETTSTGATKALMEVVDVFPMTVLRPDGHCSDEFRPPSFLDSDCLHYNLPGPVDWWSHLAFSHLNDIATAENFLVQLSA